MNKWFPDIQLRFLDVGFPTFNVTYCTSGSRRVDIAFQKLRTYQVTQTGVPANATMAPQRYMIYGCWITCGCHLRLCVLSFRFFWPFARPRVVQLPCVYGHIRIPDIMVTIYRFITHTLYKCRRCTYFVRVSQTQFRKRQLQLDMRKETKTEEDLERNAYRLMSVLSM